MAIAKKQATKKQATKKAPATRKRRQKKSDPNLVDSEGFACVKGENFWRYKAAAAEYQETQASLKQLEAEEKLELTKPEYAPLRKLHVRAAQARVDAHAKLRTLQEAQAEIAKAFSLPDLRYCSIDDLTGRIFILEGSEEKPAKPADLARVSTT